jgi:hypothetical protein
MYASKSRVQSLLKGFGQLVLEFLLYQLAARENAYKVFGVAFEVARVEQVGVGHHPKLWRHTTEE